ncbi:hypothetical protein DFH09DRAFT_931930 [Mycena vulgaris]|nr:hypothetical protein DFH09DRAFT_931930 [Mycena vulgaris]
MREITPRKPSWDGWPTDDQLLKLSEKANGLFHYAATALQWMKEQIRSRGTASQKQVFEKFAEMGIGQLEDLYRLILTSFEDIDGPAQDTEWRANQLRGFQHVIGTILVLYEPLTIHQIIALLADIQEDDFEITNFLQQFRSVLIPGMTASFEEATPQMHKSFRDYIMNNHAPSGFRILTRPAHFMTARSCLEVIVNAGSQSDIDWKYSVWHWHKHLREVVEGGATCEDERMWDLFGWMVKKTVVSVWAGYSFDVFVDVAAAGWGLLKRDTDKHRMERISRILLKARVRSMPMLIGRSTLIADNSLVHRKCVLAFPRPSVPFTATNFCLQPYQSIWNRGLLETWEDHQPPSSSMKSQPGQKCCCVVV